MNKKPVILAVPAIFILFFAISAHAIGAANIVPYTPSGWSAPVVVTTSTSSVTNTSPLYTTNEIYVDWSVINNGTASANTPFYVYLYTNSVFVNSFEIGSLPKNEYEYYTAIDVGQFPAGTNTVEIVADPTEVYDNPPTTYTNTFTVLAPILPTLSAPTLNTPANGSTAQSTSTVFTWSAVANAASYEIIVATNAADLPTNTNAVSGGVSVIINASVTNTYYTPVNPLDPGTKYYWEVNARFQTEGGPWSSTWNYTTANPPPGLTILPSWDSTITNDPQAAAIESTIRAAIAVYQSDFSDPITITITFKEMGAGLGESSWSYNTYSYSSLRSMLVAAATTSDDTNSLAHLPIQTENPVNNESNIRVKTAEGWTLGLNSGSPGENVGTVMLNTSLMNLSDAQTNPNNYSLFSTVSHEIDEVLATGSALDEVFARQITLTGPIFPEDLFRYDGSGNRNYTTNISDTSYFSIDGTTDLAQFNQVGGGDFGDWYSYYGGVIPEVQDAFATQGASPNLGVELRVLDVVGYHYVAPQTVPNFLSVNSTGNTINFVWTTVSGSSYQLLYSTNLESSAWGDVGGSILASNSTASATDTIASGQRRFYRVELMNGSSPNVKLAVPKFQPNRAQTVTPPDGWGTNVFNPSP